MGKIYGFHNGNPSNDALAVAIAEDGVIVSSHFCSSEGWSQSDLGMNGSENYHHKDYREKYPDGYEVEFVRHQNMDVHEGLQEALRLNSKLKDNDGFEGSHPSVTITTTDD